MNELEQRIREAFDDVVLPEEAKRATLEAYDRLACSDEVAGGPEMPDQATGFAVSSSVAAAARRSRARVLRRVGFAIAACMALVAIGLGGFSAYATETAQIGIDVNPSIEIGVNRFDCVVSERAVNEDGAELLGQVSLVGKSYDEAMAALSQSELFMSYVGDDAYIEINVTSDDASQAESLTQASDAYLQTLPCRGSCHTVSVEDREEALAAGMGVGRYNAALELMELDSSVTLEECRSMTMRELRDRIAAAGGDAEDASTGMGEHHGRGSGNGMRGQGAGNGRRSHPGE